MLKTSNPYHPRNQCLVERRKPETKPNQRAVDTRRRIEDLHTQRGIEQAFSL